MRALVPLMSLAACGRFKFDARSDAGDGNTVDSVLMGRCNVTDVAVGRYHTCMVEKGDVWCWGRNADWQSGPGDAPAFMTVPNLIHLPGPAVQVSAGRSFSCARLETGNVYCWGYNSLGSLGDGTSQVRDTPVQVLLGGETAIDLASGTHHACIRRASDLGVMCWGLDDHLQTGQLAGGSTPTPALVANTIGAQSLAVGHKHTCIVDVAGAPRCWGRNELGQLGTTTYNDRASADIADSAPSGLIAIAAGGRHSCGLAANGDVRCWGKNSDGQHGTTPVLGPDGVAGPIVVQGAIDVAATVAGTCAVRADHSMLCWGEASGADALGNGEAPRVSPIAGVTKIAMSYYHSCAITTGGQLGCWGLNEQAELGRGLRDVASPVTVTPIAASALSMGNGLACARTSGDEIRCWGNGAAGQIGNGVRANATTPTVVQHTLTGVLGVSASAFEACAWSGSAVQCWGSNEYGQSSGVLGPVFVPTPAIVAGIAAPSQVDVGMGFACAIDGTATKCWGENFAGQLGDGSTNDSAAPVTIAGLNGVTKLAVGFVHACALVGGNVRCWGNNAQAQLGDGTTTERHSPTASVLSNVTDLSAGRNHTCAISMGVVYCWGDNQVGQLGTGDTNPRTSPTPIAIPSVGTPVSIIATEENTCALLDNATTFCWGGNVDGQLADGTFAGHASPEPITALDGADELVRGYNAGCIRRGTVVSCWGPQWVLANGDDSLNTPRPPAGCE